MLELYHGSSSVCSAKVRVGLFEKGLDWESRPIDLKSGEQMEPEYLAINPLGVVPTLIDDGFKIFESSLILEYIDALSNENILMPTDPKEQMTAKLWLLNCIDIHAAINTMTFSTVNRQNILKAKTPDEIAASIAKMPNPKAASKRKDLLEKGVDSQYVKSDFFILRNMFEKMQEALEKHKWMGGDEYGIIDVAIIAYIDRLERLSLNGLWETRYPAISTWLENNKARPSYEASINAYNPEAAAQKGREAGLKIWPQVDKSWQEFLNQ